MFRVSILVSELFCTYIYVVDIRVVNMFTVELRVVKRGLVYRGIVALFVVKKQLRNYGPPKRL